MMEVTVNIGKQGLTQSVLEELRKELAIRKRVRVHYSPDIASGKEKRAFAFSLATLLDAKVEKAVGFVIVLVKDKFKSQS